ncbi:MAG: hypothetical protein ACRDKG_06825 [Actinomycetota bacterium]
MITHRRLARLRAAIVVALAGLLLLSALQPIADADDSPIRFLGKLPLPKEANEPGRDTQIEVFVVLPQIRRMYLKFTRGSDVLIREYDLGPKIPQPLREATLASGQEIGPFYPFSRNKTAYDAVRDRLMVLAIASGDVANCPGDPLCTSGSGAPGFVKLFNFDRKTLKRTGVFNLGVSIPGFTPQGMTYSAADDLIYMVGDVNPVGYVNPNDFLQGNNPRTLPVAVAAVEPDTGKLRWIKVVPECPVLMTTQFLGAAVYRSASTSSLYFACTQTGGINTPPYPEPSGIARVWIDPAATIAQAPSFATEYFPISGSYTTGGGISGVAAFDQNTDRFYMQSQSETLPGVWVFDGRLSGWVGFIGALDLTIAYAGINQLTGRYYVGGSTYMIPVEGRHTPVPQGRVVDIPAIQSQLYIDDPTGRILLAAQHPKTHQLEWLVYQDLAPASPPPRSVEYDELTTDLRESAATISTYSGSLSGYGMQVVLAGGTGAIIDPYCVDVQDFGCSSFRQALRDALNLSPSPGPRTLFAARVPSLDLRNVGAAAGARALAPDPVTEGEYETIVEAIAAQARQGEEGGAGDGVKAQLAWPHLGTFCINAGEDAKQDATTSRGGMAKVSCDLAKQRATATTSFESLAVEGLSVGYSSFDAESHRDPKRGIVTTATAIARSIKIDVPGAAVVDIARVVTRSSTAAHGSKGTAKATWERIFEGVVVRNGAGDVIFECAAASECDPGQAVAAMNEALKSRVHVTLPEADLIKTPGGAYAAVQESEGDFYNGLVTNDEASRAVPGLEVIVYNDTKLKSRVLVQLAAIQASSIYGISPLSEIEAPPAPGLPLPLPSLAPVVPPIIDGSTIVPPSVSSGPVARFAKTSVFLIRSPKDAFLFGLTILLLGGAVASAWRRRVLMRHLSG